MADIKTRKVDKCTIKTMDRSISASHRIRDAGSEIRQAGKREVDISEQSVSEYSTARFEEGVHRTVTKTEHTAEWCFDKGAKVVQQKMREHGVKEKQKAEVKSRDIVVRSVANENTYERANGVKSRLNGAIKNRQNIKMRKEAKQAYMKSQEAMRNATKNSYNATKTGVSLIRRVSESIARSARALYVSTKALIASIITGGWVVVVIVVCCILFGASLYLFGDQSSSNYLPVSPEVEAYTDTIEKYCKEYDIPEYVELIKAVMMQESAGKGNDPMNSGGKNPEESIKLGVQKIANLIKKKGCESPLDMSNIREMLKEYYSGDKDDEYVNNVLQYYPYGIFSDEIIILENGVLGLPVQGMSKADITSHFGLRWGRMHTGTDFGYPVGTPIYASESGTVTLAGWNGGYGKCVIVDHGNGMQTLYAHQSKIHVVKGMKVVRGQRIGETGNTGNSTGPHLHFEVIINGNKVDPMKGYLNIP